MRKALIPCLFAVSFLPAPEASAAVVFGANLEAAEPTSSFVCPGPVPPFMAPTGSATCTAYSSGRITDGAGGFFVPTGHGVVRRVEVRMPGATGPMKITVLRSLRHQNDTRAICCIGVAETSAFTPAAGRITSIDMQLKVKSELTATGVYEYDAIAVTALSPQTPIPMAPLPTGSSGGYFPAVSVGEERFTQVATLGENQVMLRIHWEPDADRDGLGDETRDAAPARQTLGLFALVPTRGVGLVGLR